ncbi:MAG: Uncharacterized protein G01um101449_133 [Parcubacteria group bacterium Gr01-1014_49]|nr:MAG: Uncharacterized protein G01um101449_133 [Parcubacteria group bacterium Gr01-1014_49]
MKNNPRIENNVAIPTGVKKIILVSGMIFFLGIAPHVFAQGFVPLATIPGLTDIQPAGGGLAEFFNNLYKYLIGLAAVLAIIEIIWGGLEYSTQDSISKKSDAKERIYQAIYGLILVLSPVLVFSIINPSILNLSLNLPALNLVAPPTPVNTGVGTPKTTLQGSTPAGATDVIQSSGQFTDRFYPCDAGGDCSAAKAKCSNDPQANFQIQGFMSVVCLQGGAVSSGERTGYSYLPFTDYSCSSGGIPSVKCIMKNK